LVDAVRESGAGGKAGPPRTHFAGWKAVLEEESSDPEFLALLQPRPIADMFWFGVSRLAQIIARDRCHLRVRGLEKLPAHGPFIICSNH
jgi:hypothetical protein